VPYVQLYYHLVWATKNRTPLLTTEVEPVIHGYIRSKAVGLGATVYALNGVADNVHLVAAIPPSTAVAKFVGQVKGVASTRFNKVGSNGGPFSWQAEYGAFSFDQKRLPNYVGYVVNQKEHHSDRHIIPALERTEDLQVAAEPGESYAVEATDWWREMLDWPGTASGDGGAR
jgi:REP element-mobilizing transposase RayT